MMNDCGKSDISIVLKKSLNKSIEQTEAERTEGREMIKGNEMQQNVCQTQCWGNMHNRLQLIHQKAKTDKKMRFTTLMHHIYRIETLEAAYKCIKHDAAPGIDKET